MKLTVAPLLLVAASSALALPAAVPKAEKSFPDMLVYVRGLDYSYAHSEEMADTIRARHEAGDLETRSSGTVFACHTAACTDCRQVFTGSFTQNSPCLSATATQCIIVKNLMDANVVFWNNAGCNGNRSVAHACGKNTAKVAAPGTNSIGVHTGC